ncbi:MAG: CDP-glycerol glycerophosphotransferase family protein [Clostridiaceae bacterium]|nr:CDP-glycerol glycerophosphotransferase family protein [Clostridiaceae bacterium]
MKNKIVSGLGQLGTREIQRVTTPVDEHRICFESKPDFSDNAWALFQYLIKNGYNRDYKICWIADRESKKVSGIPNVKVILRQNRTEVVKALYASKFVFYTHTLSGWIRPKKDQTVVNLWHGCGYKASRNAGVNRRSNIKAIMNSGKMVFDKVLVPGQAFIKAKSVFFQCSEEKVIPIGYPRYDLFRQPCGNWDQAAQEWGCQGKKVVIWMPTYRNTGDSSFKEGNMKNKYWLPLLTGDQDLEWLDEVCTVNGIVLLIKKHRLQSVFLKNKMKSIVFIDDSDLERLGIQLYEMLPHTDALVTDYSSVAVDYLLLDKPMAFTLDDYEEYAQVRGFVFEDAKKYMPGSHVLNLNDLETFMAQISRSEDLCREKRLEVLPELQNPCENYSERIVRYFGI